MIVEDEKSIGQMIRAYLVKEGYEVSLAYNGMDALKLFSDISPQLLVLDRMLPDLSGDQVCREIRSISQVPIMMLTAKSDEESRIEGFELGVDDYVVKPFTTREVVYRIQALLKRAYPNHDSFDYDDDYLQVDFQHQMLLINHKEVVLTANEMGILKVLYDHKKQPLTREQLAEQAFGYDYEAFDRNIDTYIKNIRQKIERNPKEPDYIHTKYGIGYYFGKK